MAEVLDRRGMLRDPDVYPVITCEEPGDYVFDFASARCDPAQGTHYHGTGGMCECGKRPNVITSYRPPPTPIKPARPTYTEGDAEGRPLRTNPSETMRRSRS